MWPAVKQMKEESYNQGYDTGINIGKLKFADKMVSSNRLTIEEAAMDLNLTVEGYLAAVKNLKK